MIRSLLVAVHEVRTFFRDKGDLAFSLLLPIAIFALMYGAFGGQTQFHGTANVVNQEPGAVYSELFLQRLGQQSELDLQLLTSSDADSKLERADIQLAIIIPEGFSQKLSVEQQAQLVFKQRGNGGQEGQIVASITRGVAERISQDIQVKSTVETALAGKNISQNRIEITVQKFLDREQEAPIVDIAEQSVGVPPDLARDFLPGIITMFVLFAITLTSVALVEERKNGTLERLLTTQISVGQLFFGKFLGSASRGFFQTLILLILSALVFRFFTAITFLEALVITIIFAAAGAALGLVIASISRTREQANWISVAFTMIMTMLGGTFFEITPGTVLETISKFSINTYANDAFKTVIAQQGTLANLGIELGVMAGVAVIALLVSRMIFRFTPGGR